MNKGIIMESVEVEFSKDIFNLKKKGHKIIGAKRANKALWNIKMIRKLSLNLEEAKMLRKLLLDMIFHSLYDRRWSSNFSRSCNIS